MPSENSRYLNRGPSAPLERTKLKTHLRSFEQNRLVELLWLSAQSNAALWKILMASVFMLRANSNWEKTKEANEIEKWMKNIHAI